MLVARHSEAYYVKKIRTALEAGGAKVIKHHGSAYSQAGEPDLIGCIRGKAFVIEVKVEGERPSPLQVKRMNEWLAAGAMTWVSIGDEWPNIVAAILE